MPRETVDESIEKIPDDVETLVEYIRKNKWGPVSRKSKALTFTMPGSMRYRLAVYAKLYDMSLSAVINMALLVGLSEMELETVAAYDKSQEIENIPF